MRAAKLDSDLDGGATPDGTTGGGQQRVAAAAKSSPRDKKSERMNGTVAARSTTKGTPASVGRVDSRLDAGVTLIGALIGVWALLRVWTVFAMRRRLKPLLRRTPPRLRARAGTPAGTPAGTRAPAAGGFVRSLVDAVGFRGDRRGDRIDALPPRLRRSVADGRVAALVAVPSRAPSALPLLERALAFGAVLLRGGVVPTVLRHRLVGSGAGAGMRLLPAPRSVRGRGGRATAGPPAPAPAPAPPGMPGKNIITFARAAI